MSFLDTRLPGRFWKKCIPEPNSGCWLWFGATTRKGYGSIFVQKGITESAHKFAYLALVGEVPDGLELDHRCDTRCCVNPEHLVATTHLENVRRGIRAQSLKTHCPKGHAYDERNTRRYRGERGCRACERERGARRRAAA